LNEVDDEAERGEAAAVKIAGTLSVVSGGSSGIGAATAEALAANGSHVVLLARSEPRLGEVAQRIRTRGGKADVRPVDLTIAEKTASIAVAAGS